MFTSEAVHRHNGRASERRSCRRTALQWVVLVFFQQDRWGKLVDLSERGMCFQFEHPPSLQGPINFTFEAMGCMAIPHEGQEGKVFGDSIQATGRVVWTRDFERIAGVQFLNLSPKSRDQIRYWISSGTAQDATAPSEELNNAWDKVWSQEADRKAPAPAPAAPPQFSPTPFAASEPQTSFAEAPAEFPARTFESDLENPESDIEVVWEPERSLAPASIDEPLSSQQKWPLEPEPEPTLDPPAMEESQASGATWPAESEAEAALPPQGLEEEAAPPRKWPMEAKPEPAFAREDFGSEAPDREAFWQPKSALSSEGAESLSFGMLPREERQKLGQTLEVKQQRSRVGFVAILSFLATVGVVAGIIKFTSNFNERAEGSEGVSHPFENKAAGSQAEPRALSENTTPFLVEVLDDNNRRSVLMFSGETHSAGVTGLTQDSTRSALPVNLLEARPAPGQEGAAAPKSEASDDFKLEAPHAAASGTASSIASSAGPEVPALSSEVPASADAPLRESLPSPVAPEAERPLPLGGSVQPARLLQATLPSYPQMARANRVVGDVTLDALVDEHGNVKDVKVISGPLLLREPAKEAVRLWKYEPARLDGRATAMHLTVTVKFQDKQQKR